MRHVRAIAFIIVLLLILVFFYQNVDILKTSIMIRYNFLYLLELEPTPIEIWQLLVGIVGVTALAVYIYNAVQLISQRNQIWKRDREIRRLKSRIEDTEQELERTRGQSASASSGTAPEDESSGEDEEEEAPGSGGFY